MQIFTPIGASYLSPSQNTYFPYEGLRWEVTILCYTFLESSSRANITPLWHVTLRLTVLEIFAVKIWDFQVPPMGGLCYRRAKFHVDRCHRRRDICNRTKTYSRFNMRPNALRLSIIKQTIMIITYHPDVCSEVLMCKALGGKESSTVLSLGPSLLHFIVYRCYFAFCQSALNESHAAKS